MKLLRHAISYVLTFTALTGALRAGTELFLPGTFFSSYKIPHTSEFNVMQLRWKGAIAFRMLTYVASALYTGNFQTQKNLLQSGMIQMALLAFVLMFQQSSFHSLHADTLYRMMLSMSVLSLGAATYASFFTRPLSQQGTVGTQQPSGGTSAWSVHFRLVAAFGLLMGAMDLMMPNKVLQSLSTHSHPHFTKLDTLLEMLTGVVCIGGGLSALSISRSDMQTQMLAGRWDIFHLIVSLALTQYQARHHIVDTSAWKSAYAAAIHLGWLVSAMTAMAKTSNVGLGIGEKVQQQFAKAADRVQHGGQQQQQSTGAFPSKQRDFSQGQQQQQQLQQPQAQSSTYGPSGGGGAGENLTNRFSKQSGEAQFAS